MLVKAEKRGQEKRREAEKSGPPKEDRRASFISTPNQNLCDPQDYIIFDHQELSVSV
jgi:hypothetical protein